MQHITFPLYHGTSSHFRDLFEVGGTTRPWPHAEDAIALLRATWAHLQGAGVEPEWYQANILEQSTGHANWQHGELYVAACRTPAIRYARSGAAFGGEILSQCAEALERLDVVDAAAAATLRNRFTALERFLAGGGTPLLVVVDGVPASALASEAGMRSVDEEIQAVDACRSEMDGELLEACLQGFQFRLRAGFGTVREISELKE
ncbi:hypothetical protein BHAOGJBA_1353 [Methylobacterium hispanicum]|uniref:Uncharacterized protein n=1 Tax=Methylobacterium hispanicum TaxID=270350 RepID=A0AAV4ZHQ5_9HYPH|nr:hypothetical protein [Methylobacterium hispanicum]GJD87848.1 hypothetical protein BHAOGJBA_1353 [Methylobacterium hispanicum]